MLNTDTLSFVCPELKLTRQNNNHGPATLKLFGILSFGTFSKHNDCYVLLCPVKNSLFVISNNIFFVPSLDQTSLESQFYLPPPPIFPLLLRRTLLTEFLLCAAQKNDGKGPGRHGSGHQVCPEGCHQRRGRRCGQGSGKTNLSWVWGINEEEIIVKNSKNFYSVIRG